MSEKTPTALLDSVIDDLNGIIFIAGVAGKRAELLKERLANRMCHAVKVDDCQYGCSICGYDGWMDKDAITRYCPECGANVVQP